MLNGELVSLRHADRGRRPVERLTQLLREVVEGGIQGLQVLDQVSGLANVLCANGWQGWCDAGQLIRRAG